MAEAAGGHDSDVAHYNASAIAISTAINDLLWNETLSAYRDGMTTAHSAWHTTLYMLAFGLIPLDRRTKAWETVTALSVGKPTLCNPGNVYPAFWALEAFYANASDYGHTGLAYLTCNGTNGWASMIRLGATTTMEAWNEEEKPNLTWSHPWAASPSEAVIRLLFGVRPMLPGFERILVQPQPGSLPWGNATVPSLRGAVSVAFAQTIAPDALFPSWMFLRLSLPGASTTRICLPALACGSKSEIILDDSPVVGFRDGHYVCVDNVTGGEHTAACG